jgi:hypothetical protein
MFEKSTVFKVLVPVASIDNEASAGSGIVVLGTVYAPAVSVVLVICMKSCFLICSNQESREQGAMEDAKARPR